MSKISATNSGITDNGINIITLAKFWLRFVGEHKWLFASIGLISVIAHFWRIGYLPQITMADVGLVAAATTFFTFVAIALFLFVVLGPALCFVVWSNAEFIPRAPSERLRARRPVRATCTGCHQQLPKSSRPNLVRKTMLPILLIAYGGFLVAASFWAFFLSFALPGNWSVIAISITLLLSIVGFGIGLSKSAPTRFSTRKQRRHNRWLKYFGLCTSLYGFALPVILLVGWALLRGTENSQSSWNLALLIALPALHVLTYALQRSGLMVRTMAVAAMALYIVVFTGAVFAISDLAAAKFRLGMLKGQDVLVTPLGCDLARLSGVTQECGAVTGESGDLLCLKNVQILTRLGGHVLITDSGWKPQKPSPSVAIPATEIRGSFSAPGGEKNASDGKRKLPTIKCELSNEAAADQGIKSK